MTKNIYHHILKCMESGEKACVVTSLEGNLGSVENQLHKEVVFESCQEELIKQVLIEGIPRYDQEEQKGIIVEPFYPEERLIVLGGGHVALPLVEFAGKTGFNVTLVDDRPSFANTKRFPVAKHVVCNDFIHAIQELEIKKSDYVVIITRGHRYDRECLQKLCEGEEPRYVGMIGSRRRTAIVKQTLEAEGFDRERLARIHTPIGLAIGAITPEEIAISILSQLIAIKRLGVERHSQHNRSDIDYDVLEVLAEEVDVPKAVLTVIAAKGSAPRGAGAKMIVYEDGRLLGSIGGGCSEAAVTTQARRMIGSKTYQVVEIDLTGDAAEEEGMVCGGVMTVLIEDYIV